MLPVDCQLVHHFVVADQLYYLLLCLLWKLLAQRLLGDRRRFFWIAHYIYEPFNRLVRVLVDGNDRLQKYHRILERLLEER